MDSDLNILQRYDQTRDPDAFAELVLRHGAMVHAAAFRVTRNAADADDVTQDCFLELTRKAAQIRTSVAGWLHLKATHGALNLKRAGSARLRAMAGADGPIAAEESALWKEIAPLLDQAISELPDEQRVPLIHCYLEGRTQQDIARDLGLSRPTVGRRIEEGLLALRTTLQARGIASGATDMQGMLVGFALMPLPATVKTGLVKIGLVGLGQSGVKMAGTLAAGSAAAVKGSAGVLPFVLVAAVCASAGVLGRIYLWPALSSAPAQGSATPAARSAEPSTDLPIGKWINVTPAGIDLAPGSIADNYGIQDVLADPLHPGALYAFTCYQGMWTSADCGLTWNKASRDGGPLDHGKAWSAAIAPDGSYLLACLSAPEPKAVLTSTDGGVSWTRSPTPIALYAIAIDPVARDHVIATGLASDHLIESADGGRTWSDRGPIGVVRGDSCAISFIDGATVLAVAQAGIGTDPGTWRGTKSGSTWTWSKVGNQVHRQGAHQLSVDRVTGTIYNPGVLGIERSTDSGRTWTVVSTTAASAIAATPTALYAGRSFPQETTYAPHLQQAQRAAGSPWSEGPVPVGMSNGPKCYAVTDDGAHRIIVSGNWLAGMWRYVEPASSAPARSDPGK
jgi:RNA polymerase sigma factor (sigma-70 family)